MAILEWKIYKRYEIEKNWTSVLTTGKKRNVKKINLKEIVTKHSERSGCQFPDWDAPKEEK